MTAGKAATTVAAAKVATPGWIATLAAYLAMAAIVVATAMVRNEGFGTFIAPFLLVFLLIVPGVLFLVGLKMTDRRPTVFFGVVMGLFLLPWVLTYFVAGPAAFEPRAAPQPSAAASSWPVVTDVTASVPGAQRASTTLHQNGAQVLEARFADAAAADAHVKSVYGAAQRPAAVIAGAAGTLLSESPAIFLQQTGATVRIAQAPRRELLDALLAVPAASAPEAAPAVPPSPLGRIGAGPAFVAVLLYALFVSFVFLRLATWATVRRPDPGVAPVPAATLRSRLLDIAALDVPFTVRAGERPGELIAEWRYADARWLDHARAHAMRRVFRYSLRLDDARRTVRVLEYRAEFEASGGFDGAGLKFSVQRGITFFDYRRETVFGLQIGHGGAAPSLAYSWRFSVDEIREPLARIVTGAGWTWQQRMLDADWLTG